jgi:hypothetical protein
MADHARIFGASSFERLMLCPGSAVLCADAPRRSSQYSAEGTAIHAASAAVLQGESWPLSGYKVSADGHDFAWDADMEATGQAYVDYVLGLDGDFLMVEQRVQFGPAIGVDDPEDGFGTADAIVGKGSELIVIDLKCGRGVEVTAGRDRTLGEVDSVDRMKGPNPQLALYAIGALAEVQGLVGDFDTVRLVIVQPRAGGVSEYVMTVEELDLWAKSYALDAVTQVKLAVEFNSVTPVEPEMWRGQFLNPDEKQCKFCAAKATCPALRGEVLETVSPSVDKCTPEEFSDAMIGSVGAAQPEHWLAACLGKVDLIEDWCKAVRAEAERRLCEGQPVPGYKLVAGKRGARQWTDPQAAEEALKSYRLKVEEMYDLKLISPTSAEKLAKAKVIGPRQWPKLQGLITQNEGKPHVAPESDPRPAITVAATTDDFDLA